MAHSFVKLMVEGKVKASPRSSFFVELDGMTRSPPATLLVLKKKKKSPADIAYDC